MVRKLVVRYPRLPILFANAMVSKVTEIIKNRALGSAFDHPSMVRHVQDLPLSLEKVAGWVLYFLRGAIMTMPERGTVMGIIAQEALAESLIQVGVKVNELSVREYGKYLEVIDASQPIVHAKLVCAIKKDYRSKDRLDALLGATHDWKEIVRKAEDLVSRVDEKTKAHREARRANGWRRFL